MEAIEIELLAEKIAKKIKPPGRWMNLKKASAYSGIRKDDLVVMAKNKKIVGFKDSRLKTTPWIFDRDSIDKFRESQAFLYSSGSSNAADEKAALEIFESMGL